MLSNFIKIHKHFIRFKSNKKHYESQKILSWNDYLYINSPTCLEDQPRHIFSYDTDAYICILDSSLHPRAKFRLIPAMETFMDHYGPQLVYVQVRYWIADGSPTTPFCCTPSLISDTPLISFSDPPLTHLLL